jgi:ATP-dependent Lhr-like helicase
MAKRLAMPRDLVEAALVRLESEGQILRGRFGSTEHSETGWCNRRLLARIHRLTIGRLRREIQPVTAAEFTRFLFRWQHLAPGTQLHGVEGTLHVLAQLQGYEISAAAWESDVLPRRIANYSPELLDRLCLAGEVMWGRLSPHPAFNIIEPVAGSAPDAAGQRSGRRVRPTRVAPVTIFLREDARWLLDLGQGRQEPSLFGSPLSHPAREVLEALTRFGASFMAELVRATRRLPSEIEDALWELAAAGIVTADGFENLRALVDPKRRRGEGRDRLRRPRHAAGRWALLAPQAQKPDAVNTDSLPSPHSLAAERADAFSKQLLLRWGVVFRDLLARETLAPPWRELLVSLRRMEARGEVRGGRFVEGFLGEQFARPDAVEALRATRRMDVPLGTLRVAAADPLNLVGITTPGPRVSALANQFVDVLPQQPADARTVPSAALG